LPVSGQQFKGSKGEKPSEPELLLCSPHEGLGLPDKFLKRAVNATDIAAVDAKGAAEVIVKRLKKESPPTHPTQGYGSAEGARSGKRGT